MSPNPPAPGSSPLPTFRLDVQYVRLASTLADQGLATILLKGPAFDQLLFGGARKRAYSDIDLLVEPGRVGDAGRILERLGFQRATSSPLMALSRRVGVAVAVLVRPHAAVWVRDRDKFTVDLHHTLPLVGASGDEVWRALAAHRARITVVGSQVEALDPTAAALLIALHSAHHGPSWNRARADLERACEVLDRDCWHAAAQLARDLRAADAIGVGLRTTSAGCAVADELGLRATPAPRDRLRWMVIGWIERLHAGRSRL
jgi:putative nucleotidyltransferase-like protein